MLHRYFFVSVENVRLSGHPAIVSFFLLDSDSVGMYMGLCVCTYVGR
jgi:hypothetical protein